MYKDRSASQSPQGMAKYSSMVWRHALSTAESGGTIDRIAVDVDIGSDNVDRVGADIEAEALVG